jgi:nucleoside-diphosphate-sugar epimerase
VNCLVSGATGFIGRQLCQQLSARGDTIIALSRSGAPLPDGTPTRAVDLSIHDVETDWLRGIDVVFHLAGIAHQDAPSTAYERLNVDGSLRLARRAADAGVRCFIFLSSVKAMGPAPDGRARGEIDVSPPATPYGLSKWRAECALREQFAEGDMAIVILRPSLVYGTEPKGNLRLLARGVRMGLPRPPDGGARSMVALPDLVALLAELSRQPPAGINTWIVTGDRDYSTREVYDALRQAAGKGRGVAWLPRWGWRLVAALLDMGNRGDSESTWDKLFGAECYSNTALVEAVDWRPGHTLADMAGLIVSDQEATS